MLDLDGVRCLIVGGGQVATRKLSGLLETGAVISILSPQITSEMQSQIDAGRAIWDTRPYAQGALAAFDVQLVFAATDSPEINRQIAEEAHNLGAWVNVTSQPDISTFSNMAVIRRPPITIGLHTGGMSPALTRHLKATINDVVGEEYVTLSAWLGEMRGTIRQSIHPQAQRQALYQSILESDVLSLLRQGHTQAARERLQDIVDGWPRQ